MLPSAEWWSGTEVTVFGSHPITIKYQFPTTKNRTVESNNVMLTLIAELPICERGGHRCILQPPAGHDWDGLGPQVFGLTSTFTFW